MEYLKAEIHDMSAKIYDLQERSEHLTNGQRYAALNEIEKSIAPLRKDLHSLERKLYDQQYDEKIIAQQIDQILDQINMLENLKSDLIQKINNETERTRQELNEKIIKFMKDELSPIRTSIESNKKEIQSIKNDINTLRFDMIEAEKNREIENTKKFDRFKWIITSVVAVLTALAALSIWLEPTVQVLIHILFG